MPMSKKGRALRGVKAALAAALVAAAIPATASAETGDCPSVPVSQLFLGSGDLNNYFVAPGGDFETQGNWSVSGSYGYDKYDALLLPWAGSTALRLDDRAKATSPSFCVDSTYPHLRFTAQAVQGRDATLTVEAVAADRAPVVLGSLRRDDFRVQSLTADLPLASQLGLNTGERTQVQIRLSSSRGAWSVDGVAVDPRSGG
jgi:hypothetical protein